MTLSASFWFLAMVSIAGSVVAFVLMERARVQDDSPRFRNGFWDRYRAGRFDAKGRLARLCCMWFLVVAAISVICFVVIATGTAA